MAPRRLLAVLLALLALLAAQAPGPAAALSVAQVQTLSNVLVGFINATAGAAPNGGLRYPMLPAFVRLAFHDCAGTACDGCVNLGIASNKGLQGAVSGLESLYNNASTGVKATGISRADFWALAGLVAVNYGAKMQRSPPGTPPRAPYIPASLTPTSAFKTGRTDCVTAPVGTETDAAFPDGLKNGTDTLRFFATNFGFSAAEAVAILGAHTLGRAVPANSGFQGPWVTADNTLDNAYYKDMSNANAGWAQAQVMAPGGKIQWSRTAPPPPGAPAGAVGPTLLMLNVDMCLLKTFAVTATGAANCTYGTCRAASTAANVATYAQDNNKWLDDFGAAFAKMQNICRRTSSGANVTLTPCTLSALTGAAAARTAAVQARVARATAAPAIEGALSEAAAAAAAAEAANAAAPFVEPVRAGGDAPGRRRASRRLA